MKKLFLFIAVFTIASTAFGGVDMVITYLKGSTGSDAINIDWQSGIETGVKSYSVERSDIKTSDFKEIGTPVPATGNNTTYHYRDAAVNAAPGGHAIMPMSDLYKYRIRLNYDNAVSYSQEIRVMRPSAGVKRTWGMIKEMFR